MGGYIPPDEKMEKWLLECKAIIDEHHDTPGAKIVSAAPLGESQMALSHIEVDGKIVARFPKRPQLY